MAAVAASLSLRYHRLDVLFLERGKPTLLVFSKRFSSYIVSNVQAAFFFHYSWGISFFQKPMGFCVFYVFAVETERVSFLPSCCLVCF